ncbi:hypothetical protein L6164_009829 [Bauhinia variegata]|uniref:Uncharacterized protein n=1 Tax=Bauhinia variegata TaxID=167791 RepID=A0ACB9PMM0_BAUVA|nr:hypothetical protein L6164_009829 [Bauhinia variegata]
MLFHSTPKKRKRDMRCYPNIQDVTYFSTPLFWVNLGTTAFVGYLITKIPPKKTYWKYARARTTENLKKLENQHDDLNPS